MAVIRSLSFGNYNGYTELPDNVLGLFQKLVDNPEKQIDYASEIIDNALEGLIDYNTFDLDSYIYVIRYNDKLVKSKKKGSIVSLDTLETSHETTSYANKMRDNYYELIDEIELQDAISTINALQEDIIVRDRVDLRYNIQRALEGIPIAIDILKDLCEKHTDLKESLRIVLTSGKTFNQMFLVSY